MSKVATTSEAEMLREGMNDIADKLCALITGDLRSGLSLATSDGTLRKLSMMVNLVIEICQRTLRESEERELQLRSILDAASEGMMTIDQNDIVESFNKAAISMFGYDAQEVIGRHIKMLIPGATKRVTGTLWTRACGATPPRSGTRSRAGGRTVPCSPWSWP